MCYNSFCKIFEWHLLPKSVQVPKSKVQRMLLPIQLVNLVPKNLYMTNYSLGVLVNLLVPFGTNCCVGF
jgi:hypothetical protein